MLAFQELAIIVLALGLGGLMKGVTGMGLPLVAVPAMASFLGVERTVLIMVVPSLVLNAVQAVAHRDARHEVPEVARLVASGMLGAVFGATILNIASERALATGLAAWIVVYVIWRFLHPSFELGAAARRRWSPLVGLGAGALQAATGISAPIVAAYTDALHLSPRAYVFAVCAAFGAFAGAHFGYLLALDIYSRDLLLQGLLAIVPALAFVPVGVWLRRFISRRMFDMIVRLTLLAMAVRLCVGAWLIDMP